jgi:hypothetical protein
MLAPAPLVLRPLARGLLGAAMAASVAVQGIGAFWYTNTSDDLIFGGNRASMRGAWDVRNIPFLAELRHAHAPGELQCGTLGSLDQIGDTLLPSGDGLPELASGATIAGWMLVCERSPAQVRLLVDGIVVGSTSAFFARADVARTIGIEAPSGWRIAARVSGVTPGERVLQLAAKGEPRSAFRIVREQRVIVRPDATAPGDAHAPATPTATLDAMAARAAALLREHQTEYGAWLAAHTTSLRYDSPQRELNTFLTSMLADLLSPLARRHGLDAPLQRAHAHLAAQIEADGLVRYHGLPDAPTIGTLGCAITPDADDTALAWRIAGPGADDPRRQRMLATLTRYRDSRGFYRTWLAPQANYQCIDPGADPNPADIAIQMHVYLMLREFDAPSARALCSAMRRRIGEDSNWVYYARSPLLPFLRAAELGGAGCALPLPSAHLARAVEGQAIWSELAQALVEGTAAPLDPSRRQAADRVLAQLGHDDFALIRRAPPLLYHNDLTATVPRYYWSEDAGYALWLRLYDAVGGGSEPLQPRAP